MKWFKFWIGDYQRDTAHLSLAEHGAFMLMLQHYYATEKPLPSGATLHRMLRAQSKQEREAIDSVARQFWTLTPDGLVNERADEELGKADERRETNRELGKRGGRPKKHEQKTDSVSVLKTDSVSESLTERQTEHESEREPTENPNQTPDSRQLGIHPLTPSRKRPGTVHDFPPGFEAFWSAYPRKLAKAQAAKAFARLKPDESLLARILASLQAQAAGEAWQRDGGRFVPHAATWLNGRRWEDELVSAKPANDVFAGAL